MLTSRLLNRGVTKRTPAQQIALAVRIIEQKHGQDVIERARDILGSRGSQIGPVDLTRNPLRSYCDRVGRAYSGAPPLVSGLTADLAGVMDDASASTTIARYATAGGHPMPSPMVAAASEALRYRIGCGYSGLLIGMVPRRGVVYLEVVPPDVLDLTYASDDPTEPTVIRHRGVREVGGEPKEVEDVYDLTDLDAPSYRVMIGSDDVTMEALGRSFSGESWPDEWRDVDGVPFHRMAITGHPRLAYERSPLIEASLVVPVRWTAWGSGTDNASHPQRNVRGLSLAGADSATGDGYGEHGQAVGPETVLQWVDTDPEKPGTHWQDAPAFDPETLAKAIRTYEMSITSALDLPMSWEGTGGEPSAVEAAALAERIGATYAECRRFDRQVLMRSASIAGLVPGKYGVLYREEVAEAMPKPEIEEPEDAE